VWVAQEIVQAPYPPKFCFGSYELSNRDLPRLAFSLAWGPADALVTAIDKLLTMKLNNLQLLHELDTRDVLMNFPRSQALDLYDVFLRTKGLDATDPQDHIYNLLGIAGSNWGPWNIRPDYSFGIADLYTQTTYHILDMMETLHVLASSPHDSNYMHNMPTWAVDFRNLADMDDRLVIPPDRLSLRLVLSLNQNHTYSKASAKLIADQKLLEISGSMLDEVARVFACGHKNRALRSDELHIIISMLEDLPLSPFCSPSMRFEGKDMRSSLPELQHLRRKTTPLLELMSTIEDFWVRLNHYSLVLGRDYGHAALPWLYFGFKSHGTSLFVTRQGLIGFGSLSIRVDDLLVLLNGSPAHLLFIAVALTSSFVGAHMLQAWKTCYISALGTVAVHSST
jgi:hypothetical protein